MTGLVFGDANVLLYAVDTRDPAKQHRATEWITRLWRERSGRTGVQELAGDYAAQVHPAPRRGRGRPRTRRAPD